MERITRSASRSLVYGLLLFILIGLTLPMPKAQAAETEQLSQARNQELLLVVGRSSTSQKMGAISLGILDPLTTSGVDWILDLPSMGGTEWLGIFNGAFYFIAPDKTLKMVHLDSGSMISLDTIAVYARQDEIIVGRRMADEETAFYFRYDLRKRTRLAIPEPVLAEEGWQPGPDSPGRIYKLYSRMDYEPELDSMIVKIKVFDRLDGAWGIERIVRLPLSLMPFFFRVQPQMPGRSSFTITLPSLEQAGLLPQWYDDEHLLVRAPAGIMDSNDLKEIADIQGLGLWILNVRTGESVPLELETSQLAHLLSGQGSSYSNQIAIAPNRDFSSLQILPMAGSQSYHERYGPFYAMQRSTKISGLLCGNTPIGESLIISDRRVQGYRGGQAATVYVSPSLSRVAFKSNYDSYIHDVANGSLRDLRRATPLGWVKLKELAYVPGEEIPFSAMATSTENQSFIRFERRISDRREAFGQLKLEATIIETLEAENSTVLLELAIKNESDEGAWLVPPGSTVALRGTLIAPFSTIELNEYAIQSDEPDVPQYVAPGASLVSNMRLSTLAEGAYLLVPGYYQYDQHRSDLLISGEPIRFEIGENSGDAVEQRLMHLVETNILSGNQTLELLVDLAVKARTSHDRLLAEKLEAQHKEFGDHFKRVKHEFLLYPSQSISVIKKRILLLAEQQGTIAESGEQFVNLYEFLEVVSGGSVSEFVLERLENGTPLEQKGVIALLRKMAVQGGRQQIPYNKILDALRRIGETSPSISQDALRAILSRIPNSYDAEDLVRSLIASLQENPSDLDLHHIQVGKRYIVEHRASQRLPLNEECISILKQMTERSRGGTNRILATVLERFYETDPDSTVVRDLMDGLLPWNREAVQNYARNYAKLGSDWLRYAATHPMKERVAHGCLIVSELEKATGQKLGAMPQGEWADIRENKEMMKDFESTMITWAAYVDANKLDVQIP